ncbi:MAG: peptidoglycan DD-metalloendopeptidase family protein [Acidimicrobiia bacterium]
MGGIRPTDARGAPRARSRALRWWPARVVAAATVLVLAGSGACAAPPAHAAESGPGWQRPVPGAVVRPFAEPTAAFGPGHRGVDYAAAPGAPVAAAGRGTVVFAGDVAGSLHVVVLHRGAVRTSYSYLLDVTVAVGDTVDAGTPVGHAGGADPDGGHDAGVLHFGVRVGERYVDPQLLGRPHDLRDLVRLVPLADADPGVGTSWARARADEPVTLQQGLGRLAGAPPGAGAPGDGGCGGGIPVLGSAVDAVCAGVDWAAGQTRQALRAGLVVLAGAGRVGRALVAKLGPALDDLLDQIARGGALLRDRLLDSPLGRSLADVVEIGERFLEWTHRECATDAPAADGTGGSGHVVMGVAGIDSASPGADRRSFGLDVDALGYQHDEVHWFSYAADGGAYEKDDTHGDLRTAAKRLAAQLRAIDAAEPGREVDLIAHSQGGVVVERFLRFEYDASDPSFPPLGTVVTLSSPHEGAPIATSARELAEHRKTRRAVEVLDRVLPGPPVDAPSVRQLAEDSPFMERLHAAPFPDHVELTTVGGTDDLIVPANRIHVPGATEVVVGVDGLSDHTAIHHDDRALQVVRSALEHRPPPCTSFLEGVRGAVEPVLLSRVEGDLGEYLTTYLEVGR